MKRFSIIMLSVALFLSLCACTKVHEEEPFIPEEGIDTELQVAYGTVQVLEEISDTEESSYRIGAGLPGSDFSTIGQILSDKIKQEWDEFERLSDLQMFASSHAWGTIYLKTDTWSECEEAIGFRVNNPLESFEWLNKTGYFGMESADPNNPVTHVHATAYASRALSSLSITAGYNTEKVKVSITATLHVADGIYTNGNVYKGYVTYKQNNVNTGSGIPVLIVTADMANNTGYYNGDFFTPTAYWVMDNVFYTLRVSGVESDKAEVQATLEQILERI